MTGNQNGRSRPIITVEEEGRNCSVEMIGEKHRKYQAMEYIEW